MANYDCARVEFWLGKADKDANKKAFDLLYSHKDEIETTLGMSLKWNRNDDVKSSNELCPCGSGMKYKKCCGKNK